nr:zinc finger, CCHC-type [Tanacetum cinerariifolium]
MTPKMVAGIGTITPHKTDVMEECWENYSSSSTSFEKLQRSYQKEQKTRPKTIEMQQKGGNLQGENAVVKQLSSITELEDFDFNDVPEFLMDGTLLGCDDNIESLINDTPCNNRGGEEVDSYFQGEVKKEMDLVEMNSHQPKGFVMLGIEHKVCKLVKSLYGLKQAPKQWHQKFDEVVLSSGFLLNQSDKCVYSKFDNSGKGVIICLYVDDMLSFGTDQNQVDKTKKFLSSRFSMKDMREADVILGIKIKRENKRIVIIQSHYIEKILKKFNREDCSSVENLKPNTGRPVDQLEYLRAIGCLMYAMTSTRPDIAYVVGRLSRFIFYEWMGVPAWGGAISWASKKQTCITGPNMESEFMTLTA